MSRYYDVVIVGAGIAGTGLAYNLKREGYKGSVLIIDKKEPGSNAAFVYRNTFPETIREYNLPYEHVFQGAIVGTYAHPTEINEKFYFINYKKVCNFLFKNSFAGYREEKAINVRGNLLATNQNTYRFRYFIDCSGASFFLRKLYNLPMPFRYWIGNVKLLKNKVNLGNYFYYFAKEDGYMEDFYSVNDIIMQGDWQYVSHINFNLIKICKNNFFNKYIKNPKEIKQEKVIIPATFVLPITMKNYAFLGDSFGNATTSASEGIRPILDSSKILAEAIINNNLKAYEEIWVKKNYELYIKKLALKINNELKIKLLNFIPDNSELLKKLMKNERVEIPKQIKRNIPLSLKIKVLKNYIYLKTRYTIMSKQLHSYWENKL